MKTKRMGRQCFSLPFGKTAILSLVTFAMVIGLFLGMGVKAFADPSGSGVSSLPSKAGTYYLTGDVTISSSWTPVNGITLDLNGKTITMNGSDNAITVSKGVTLTIKDSSSSNSGKITHGSNIKGRGVQVQSGGTFHMTGGSITANNCSADGAGVYVAGAADFSKTTISYNTAAGSGGGIYVHNGGTLSVADCTIDGNITDKSYGSPPCGGGVSVAGTATFSGNTRITNNWTKQNSGGGIHVSGDNASITIHDNVQITGNKAFANGGGIFLKFNASMYISGAPVIKNNYANYENTQNKVGPNLDVEKLITIDGPLTGNPGDIHIFLDLGGHAGGVSGTVVNTGVFTNSSDYIDDSTPSKFSCDNSGGNVIRDSKCLSVAPKYQIAYNVNGRTGITAPNTQTADLSTSVTLATINNDCFLNWNTKKDGSGTSYNGGATITPSSNLYLYAQWHTHNWTYAASGDTITATCSGTGTCPIGNQTAKLSLNNTSFTYGNTNISPTVTVSNAWTTGNGLVAPPTVSDVKYQGRGGTSYSSSITKPTNAGDYTATLTAGGKTAKINFTISKATNPLTYTATQSVTKTFSTSSQTVTLAAATKNQGTLSYAINSQKQGNTTVNYFTLSGTTLTIANNTPAQTYTVVIRATAEGNSNYNSGTKDSTVTVTINKAGNPISYDSTQTVTETFSTSSQTVTLAAATKNQGTLSYAINSQTQGSTTVNYFSLSGTQLTIAPNTPANTYTVIIKATAAGNDNYERGTKDSTVTVTINKAGNPLIYASLQPVEKACNNITQSATLAAATNGEGAVTYAIHSQQDSSGTAVDYFSISDTNSTVLTIAAGTPVKTYSVVVRATAAGNANYESGTADSTVTVTIKEPEASVTSSNGSVQNYLTIKEATESWPDGSTLTLLADVETASTINVTGGTKTLDLNGHTMKRMNGKNPNVMYLSQSGIDLTIKDSQGGGRITGVEEQTSHYNKYYYAAIRIDSGEVTLESGIIEWFGCSFSLRNGAILNLSGGTIKSKHTERGNPYNNSSVWTDSTFNGTIYLTGTNIENTIGSGIYTQSSSGKVVISGGSYTVTENQVDEKDGYAVTGVDQGTIELSGSPDLGNKGIYLLNDQKLTITGELKNTKPNTKPIHITMETPGVFTNTASGNLTYNDASKFISGNSDCKVGKNAEGQLLLGERCTVTYNANEGNNAPTDSNSPYAKGSIVTVLGNTGKMARNGYVFVGWNTKQDGNGTSYMAGDATKDSFTITANTTLYAQWWPHTHNWSYSSSGDTITATCGNSDTKHPVGFSLTDTIKINAPTGILTYDGTTTFPAALTNGAATPAAKTTIGDQTPTIQYKMKNGTSWKSITGEPVNAGTYMASITLTGVPVTGNSTGTVTATTAEFTIAKAAITPTVNITGWTYGDNPKTPSVTGNTGGGAVTYEYKVKDAADSTYSNTVPTAAGTYTVKATIAATSNYDAGTATIDFTIAQKSVTVSGIISSNKAYDGNTNATLNYTGVALAGLVSGDDLSVTATGTFDNKNVGTGKTVTISGLTLGGTDAGNYVLATSGQQTTATADITAISVTVSGIKANNKTYNGNTAATLDYSSVSIAGMVTGDNLTVSVIGQFSDKQVGNGKTVSISGLTLGGTDAGNYVLATSGQQTTATADITAISVTVSGIKANNKTYNGNTAATLDYLSVSIAGMVSGDNLTVSAAGQFADKTIGNGKTVSISGLTLGGTDAGNYVLAATGQQTTATADITAISVTVSGIKANNKTYNGNTAATLDYSSVSIAGMVTGDNLTVSAIGQFSDKQVGNGKTVSISGLTLGGTDAGNYVLAATGQQTTATADITAISVTVSGIKANNKTYNGNTAATLDYLSVSIAGMVSGDNLTVSAAGQFADKTIGNGKTVSISGLTLGGTDAGNYVLAATGQQTTATANITEREITVTGITAFNKSYDGNTTATLNYTGATLAGLISGDDLSVSAAGTFNNKNVGTGKTVTISGLTLGGTDSGNYVLATSGQQDTATADITQREITVTGITASNKSYDGNTTATLNYTGATLTGQISGDDLSVSAAGTFADANAGENKTVTISNLTLNGTAKDNYKLSESQQTETKATIAPKSLNGANITLDKTQLTFNGAEQSVSVTEVTIDNLKPGADDYDVTGNKGTDAKTYTVTILGKGNYKDSATVGWEIAAKSMTVNAENVTTGYDGHTHGITVNVTDPASGVQIKYGIEEGTYDLDASPTITDVKDSPLTVYYKVSANNYLDYTGSAKVTLSKKNATAAAISAINRTYDGTEKPLVTVDDSTLDGGEMQYALGMNATTAPTTGYTTSIPAKTNAGTYHVWYKAVGDANHTDSAAACVTARILAPISATVTFRVVGGSWNDGTDDDRTVKLTGHEGDVLKLAAAQIPAVGGKPADTYKAGAWDTTPSTSATISGNPTYTYTYAKKSTISATVTFKVMDGSWDDGTAEAKTVTLTGYEGDTLKLASGDIPAVGSKPNTNYKAGGWDTTPSTNTAITGATTYTYTYAKKSTISATVTFKVVNGSWDDGTAEDKTVTLTGHEGDTLKLAAADIPAVGDKPDAHYKAGAWDVTPSAETAITGDTTYTYTYVKKSAISAKVTFKVVNGSWDDGTAEAKTVTLTGHEGEALKLAAADIPSVGGKPAEGYKAGTWDVTPSAETAITQDMTYTYTYEKEESAAAAEVAKAPKAKKLTYSGAAQELVTAGEARGGEMVYAATRDKQAPEPSAYEKSIPVGTDAGTYYVWYKAAGDTDHTDSEPARVKAKIKPIDIGKCKITAKNLTWTGKKLAPSVTVRYGKKTLKQDTDYTLTCEGKVKAVGSYAATVTGKGNYAGSQKLGFRVNPKGTALTKAKGGEQQIELAWKRQEGVTGYQVQYSLKKDFSGAETVKVKGTDSVSTTIKGLKAEKKYYLRIRTWKKVGKKTYVSDWSKAKAAKTQAEEKARVVQVEMNVGDKLNLKKQLTKAEAKTVKKWSSSDPKIAKVSKKGVATALKAGEAVITATCKDGTEVRFEVSVSEQGDYYIEINLDDAISDTDVDESPGENDVEMEFEIEGM